MSRRNKLWKFSELLKFPNVYQNFDISDPKLVGVDNVEVDMKGNWAKTHFKNEQEIVLELACGRGEYTLGLATAFPNRNFIGVDIKGARIWQGARKALDNQLGNAAFLRTKIEMINRYFGEEEVSEIWITFPDPFIRKSKANRRLTAPNFLNAYRKLLKPGGKINLKTDAPSLYEYTMEVLQEDENVSILYHHDDIYSHPLYTPELELKTYYERMHLENLKTIKFVQFTVS